MTGRRDTSMTKSVMLLVSVKVHGLFERRLALWKEALREADVIAGH